MLVCNCRHHLRAFTLAMFALALFGSTHVAHAGAIYSVVLSGADEAPPNASPGSGVATITFDVIAHTMRIETSFSGLLGTTTAAHIHAATAVAGTGTAGVATQTPFFTGFPIGVTSGSYDHTFDLTLASSFSASFLGNNGGTTASAESALLAAAANGRAYLNIHTTVYAGGEIRGFLQAQANPVPEPSSLLVLSSLLGCLAMKRWRLIPSHAT